MPHYRIQVDLLVEDENATEARARAARALAQIGTAVDGPTGKTVGLRYLIGNIMRAAAPTPPRKTPRQIADRPGPIASDRTG